MLDYMMRSLFQIKRFRGRNITIVIGLTVMVMAATVLLNFSIQIDSLFKQKNLELLKKFQYLHISNHGREFSQASLESIQEMSGVEKILPITNGMRKYDWISTINLESYIVLPIYVASYDPTYARKFFSGDLMVSAQMNEFGAIVSSDFRKNMMTTEQFQSIFQNNNSILSFESSRNIQNYQEHDFPIAEEIKDLSLVGKRLTITLDSQYDEDMKHQIITVPIVGEYLPDDLFSLKNLVYLPKDLFDSPDASTVKLDGLYIKTKTLEDVPKVINQLKNNGYTAVTNLDSLKRFLDTQKQFLLNILLIMASILLIAIFSFSNTMQSMIQERKNEIALMKALGASSSQITIGFVLEGIILALISLLIGFFSVTLLFKIVSIMISTEAINPAYFSAFRLDKASALFLFNIPISIFGFVSLGATLLGFVVSYIPARIFLKQNYITLLRKD